MSGRFGNLASEERLVGVAHLAMRVVPAGEDASEEHDAGGHDVLSRAAAGDEAAVRRLYRLHVGRIHRHVARILGPHDPDVEDVVQQVFLAALDGAARFDGRSNVARWLLGIATRRALDAARSRARRRRWSRIAERVGLGRPASRPDDHHGVVDEAQAALAGLKPAQRTVFVLHDVEGYTLAEIREMTGTKISTLHARLKGARRRLDRAVAVDVGEPSDEAATESGRSEGGGDGTAA